MPCDEQIRHRHGQRGAATLVISVLLLFSLSLMLLYAARVGVVEQRLAANDAQARAASAAAQAGLERLLADLAGLDRGAVAYDAAGRATVVVRAGTLPNGSAYSAEAHNRGLAAYQTDLLRLEARGTTGPGGGTRTLTQLAAFAPLLPNPPPAPLVVRGDLVTEPTLALANPEGPAAWLGGAYSPGTGDADTHLSDPAACPPLGICAEDARLADLTPEVFFENTFGRTPAVLRAMARIASCAACDLAALPTEWELVWLDNAGAAVTPAAGALGTEDRPVVAVVAGDFAPAGPLQIHGLLFVLGDWLAGGAALRVEGAVLVAGDAVAGGPAQLNRHAGILDALQARGRYGTVPGSWSDF